MSIVIISADRPSRRAAIGTGARSAFTMIELLIVIAILVALGAALMVSITVVRESAAKREAETELQRLHTAFTQYLLEKPVPVDADTGNDGSGYLYYGDLTTTSGDQRSSALKWLRELETYSFSGQGAVDPQGYLLDPWHQRYCFVVGTAADPGGNSSPSQLIASGTMTDWIPVNRNANADSRIYIYSFGPKNPTGSELDRWIYNRTR